MHVQARCGLCPLAINQMGGLREDQEKRERRGRELTVKVWTATFGMPMASVCAAQYSCSRMPTARAPARARVTPPNRDRLIWPEWWSRQRRPRGRGRGMGIWGGDGCGTRGSTPIEHVVKLEASPRGSTTAVVWDWARWLLLCDC